MPIVGLPSGGSAARTALENLPSLAIGTFPTPVHALERLSEHLGGPRILVKREDLCGVGLGGNKVRKLRCLIADALAKGATTIVTRGGVQSNHCAQTAVVASMFGLRAVLVLTGAARSVPTGNTLVNELTDADMVYAGGADEDEVQQLIATVLDDLRSRGQRPYFVGLGGSDLLGALATAPAMGEVAAQVSHVPEHVVVATGSVGTLAGIAIGAAAYGLDVEIDGISVLWPQERVQRVLDALVSDAADWSDGSMPPMPKIRVTDAFVGEGYGLATAEARAAQEVVARCEGLILDDTYTSKAMAGLFDGVRAGRYAPDDTVLFWHSGGIGGFFARSDV